LDGFVGAVSTEVEFSALSPPYSEGDDTFMEGWTREQVSILTGVSPPEARILLIALSQSFSEVSLKTLRKFK
jgi:hypothetical protein